MAEAAPNWRDGLAPELKDAPALKNVPDVGTLAKNYVEAQAMIGRSVRLPSKEAGEEDRKAFRTRLLEVGKDHGVVPLPQEGEDDTAFWRTLGYPEKPEAYAYDVKPPEGVTLEEGDVNMLRAAAHKAKLTPKQFQVVLGEMLGAQAPVVQEHRQRALQGTEALKKEWGESYDTRVAQVGKLLEQYKAPPVVMNAFKNDIMDAASKRWLWDILSAFGGEPLEVTRTKFNQEGSLADSAEALARVAEIEKRLANMTPGDPEYQTLLQRRVQLMEKAYPEPKAA